MNLDGVHMDFRAGERVMDLTCAAGSRFARLFYRVDLHHAACGDLRGLNLPVPGLHGLEEAA